MSRKSLVDTASDARQRRSDAQYDVLKHIRIHPSIVRELPADLAMLVTKMLQRDDEWRAAQNAVSAYDMSRAAPSSVTPPRP